MAADNLTAFMKSLSLKDPQDNRGAAASSETRSASTPADVPPTYDAELVERVKRANEEARRLKTRNTAASIQESTAAARQPPKPQKTATLKSTAPLNQEPTVITFEPAGPLNQNRTVITFEPVGPLNQNRPSLTRQGPKYYSPPSSPPPTKSYSTPPPKFFIPTPKQTLHLVGHHIPYISAGSIAAFSSLPSAQRFALTHAHTLGQPTSLSTTPTTFTIMINQPDEQSRVDIISYSLRMDLNGMTRVYTVHEHMAGSAVSFGGAFASNEAAERRCVDLTNGKMRRGNEGYKRWVDDGDCMHVVAQVQGLAYHWYVQVFVLDVL